MLSFQYVKEHLSELEGVGAMFGARFTSRFLNFLPVEEWSDYGFEPSEDFDRDGYIPKDWTEENVLAQLRRDVEFGIEKAIWHRGISASLMFEVVKNWCIVLENGLDNVDYGWYGDALFRAVDEKYGFGLVKENTFDEDFYKEW